MKNNNKQCEKFPKVSVCVVTYNHEKYIRQCLQSVMDQETDFDYEVIVADDCSTDGTRAIVNEFVIRYQGVVKSIFHEENIGAFKNFVYVHNQAKGEYLAHIDGDDFMLPNKLKIQVGELDKNPDCAVCFHAMKQFDQHAQCYRKLLPKAIPRKSDINYLMMNFSLFAHSSKMYRKDCRNGLELFAKDAVDVFIHIHHALKGKILYLTDALGVYRLNVGIATGNGSSNNIPNPKIQRLIFEAIEYARVSGVGADIINKSKANLYFRHSVRYLLGNDVKNFQAFIEESYKAARLNNAQLFFKLFSGMPSFLLLLLRLKRFVRAIY